jgi:hypothetical protein
MWAQVSGFFKKKIWILIQSDIILHLNLKKLLWQTKLITQD